MDVTPDKQNLDMLFGNITYHIDFYQRQYKWTSGPVIRLLDDIFYKFGMEYGKYKDNDVALDKLIERYSWYYLNTYVTNTVDGNCFVVDGQQRLTTLTLILIKLKLLAEGFQSELRDWISTKIAGQSGYRKEYWMNHEAHKQTLQALMDSLNLDDIDTSHGITSENMVGNYKLISKYLDRELVDKRKFETFVFYYLKRLVLINLNVEQTDVPMVFEVINDRGVRLKSYEILKGKLLGEIDKVELESLKLNDLWDSQVEKINKFKSDEIETFFIHYLRSQYADTVGEGKNYDRDYHRKMFTPEIDKNLRLLHNPKAIKSFLSNEFKYYTNLYARMYTYYSCPDPKYIHIYYNNLTEMDSQFMLVLSACSLDDPEEDEKLKIVSFNVDRMFSLLQLQRSYNSNEFNVNIYKISSEIRGQSPEIINSIFEKYLLKMLTDARGSETTDVFSYGLFKDTGIDLRKRFKRYFFARVESFISENTNLNMKQSFYDLVANTGSVNGFHIEHILAQNDENHGLFKGDDDLFERERNRLGALLLLKGKDNISSNNELYRDKLNSYANTLYWNETLRADTYKSKLDFTAMADRFQLDFRPMESFGPMELEERHKLLFSLAKIIFGNR